MIKAGELVTSAEADFDVGLLERIKLIATIFEKNGTFNGGTPSMVMTNHKRNKPQSIKEYLDIIYRYRELKSDQLDGCRRLRLTSLRYVRWIL